MEPVASPATVGSITWTALTASNTARLCLGVGLVGALLIMASFLSHSPTTQQRCAFVTFEHHVSALAATKLSGMHRMTANDRPIVVRFADAQGENKKRQRT